MTQKVYKLINADVSTGGASGKVKVSSLDTSADFLNSKVVTDSTITKTTLNPGNVEQIQLSVDATALEHGDLQNSGTLTHDQLETAIEDLESKTDKYVHSFNATTDWSLNVDVYELTVTAITHEKGENPLFYVVDSNGDVIELSDNVDSNGDIKITVADDLRFAGKLIIL